MYYADDHDQWDGWYKTKNNNNNNNKSNMESTNLELSIQNVLYSTNFELSIHNVCIFPIVTGQIIVH